MSSMRMQGYAAAILAILSAAWISPQAFAQSGGASARVEETDPSVSYTVGWTQGDSGKTWSAPLRVNDDCT